MPPKRTPAIRAARPIVLPKKSYAYGAPGVATTATKLTTNAGIGPAADAIEAMVKTAQARPAGTMAAAKGTYQNNLPSQDQAAPQLTGETITIDDDNDEDGAQQDDESNGDTEEEEDGEDGQQEEEGDEEDEEQEEEDEEDYAQDDKQKKDDNVKAHQTRTTNATNRFSGENFLDGKTGRNGQTSLPPGGRSAGLGSKPARRSWARILGSWLRPCLFLLLQTGIFITMVVVFFQLLRVVPPLPDLRASVVDLGSSVGDFFRAPSTARNHSADDYNILRSLLSESQRIPNTIRSEYATLGTRLSQVESNVRVLSKGATQYTKSKPRTTARVNYFAPGLGTAIDPYLTSPTKPFTLLNPAYSSSYVPRLPRLSRLLYPPSASEFPLPPGPIMALMPWDDFGECWCAPSSGGKSQLAVVLARRLIPQELIVEHIDRTASLSIGSAPRSIFLVAHIPDAALRTRARQYFDAAPDTTVPFAMPREKGYATTGSLNDEWVGIGHMIYDIQAGGAQSLFVEHWFTAAEIPVGKVVVRVASNWGSVEGGKVIDHVCLYRLKLHGLFAEEL